MQKSSVLVVAFVSMQGGALFAQTLAGTWQGPMQVSQAPGDILHVVFKITTTVGGSLKGDMYSIDQGGQAPAPDVTLKGSAVRIAMPSIGATYIGNLSADGNSITGKWTGPGNALTLNLTRATAETAWKIPEPPPPPRMMPAGADPRFEVATVKPTDPGGRGGGFHVQGRQFSAINMSASNLILFAYGIHSRQLIGAPDWIEKDGYDVLGKPDVEGQPNNRQTRALIQKLLADRFQLKFHREKKELAVYTITVTKTGSKITKSEADPAGLPTLLFGRAPQGANFNVRNATLADVAGVLQGAVLDKPVVDQTGLAEKYDFVLKFTPDSSQMTGFGPPPPAPAGAAAVDPGDAFPDLFTAFQQQLGLKLESTKAPADVIVIDKVEKPSAN